MNIQEAARMIGVNPETVRELVYAGILEAERVWDTRLWRYEVLDADVAEVAQRYKRDRMWRVKQTQAQINAEQRQRTRELMDRGLTARQIAQALGITLSAARKRCERLRKVIG